MSLKSGTRRIVQGSRVSNVAARIGKAEFFEPLILTDPEREFPPWTIILSIPCDENALDSLVILPETNVAIIRLRQNVSHRS